MIRLVQMHYFYLLGTLVILHKVKVHVRSVGTYVHSPDIWLHGPMVPVELQVQSYGKTQMQLTVTHNISGEFC